MYLTHADTCAPRMAAPWEPCYLVLTYTLPLVSGLVAKVGVMTRAHLSNGDWWRPSLDNLAYHIL